MTETQDALRLSKNKRVLVVGDIMLDRYTHGDVTRISPEAPIPVMKSIRDSNTIGGAANVAHNIVSLGARAVLCGVIGADQNGKILLKLLKGKEIDSSAIIIDPSRQTTLKHRMMSGGVQLLRLDDESTEPLHSRYEKKLLMLVTKKVKECDVVILSDYAKGFFTPSITKRIVTIAHAAGKKVLADIKPVNKDLFVGVDLLSPNAKEAQEMSGLSEIEEIGKHLVKKFNSDVCITRGKDGMSIFDRKHNVWHIPAKKVEVHDVSGAGDTVIALLALGLSTGLPLNYAGALANHAGSLVVQKSGTAVLTVHELLSAIESEKRIDSAYVVEKLWGSERWLENNAKYCCKILTLKKGYQCSLHYHKEKDETFLVQSGYVVLELAEKIIHMRPGHFERIPPNTKHRFTGIEDSVIIETSTHHDEGDSHRKERSRKSSAAWLKKMSELS